MALRTLNISLKANNLDKIQSMRSRKDEGCLIRHWKNLSQSSWQVSVLNCLNVLKASGDWLLASLCCNVSCWVPEKWFDFDQTFNKQTGCFWSYALIFTKSTKKCCENYQTLHLNLTVHITWIRDTSKQLLAMWVDVDNLIPTMKAFNEMWRLDYQCHW